MEAGKRLREKFPRIHHGYYQPSANRPDPVSILEEQAKSRLPELVPIRYARMLTSPFAFLRGAAAIMAADLAENNTATGITVQTCGDMHVANFGVFASAERNIIFGINDFDETLPGPWEWDLKRLAASLVAAGRFLGADEKLCDESVRAGVSSYAKRMKQYASMGILELHYTTIDEKAIIKAMPGMEKAVKRVTNKARTRTHMQVLDKLTDLVDERYRLRDDAPFIVHQTHTQAGLPIEEALAQFLESYFHSLSDERKKLLEHYRIVDVARKVVGVGSVGTRCWVIFLTGQNEDDPLFLQLKEAQPSVLEPFLPKSVYAYHGQRVVAGQRLIQGAPDIFLGWGEMNGLHFYVRQLRDMKGGIDFDPDKVNIKYMPNYANICAWALALAHAKSGDAAMIAGYVGNGDELGEGMANFAVAYANQTEADHAELAKAAKSKRIQVAEAAE
jgi:uncharacterized protein (DUF2252 family)